MNYRQRIGSSAEHIALQFLQRKHLKLVSKNYRCKRGEVDLIMHNKSTLVFIEVRFRRNEDYGGSLASITPKKQSRIIRAAYHFLHTHPHWQSWHCRFDAIGQNKQELQWIQHAFDINSSNCDDACGIL